MALVVLIKQNLQGKHYIAYRQYIAQTRVSMHYDNMTASLPDFGIGAQLHHVVTAEAVLPTLLPVVGADGLAIQEGAIQAACVCDLPTAFTRLPPDHDMVS